MPALVPGIHGLLLDREVSPGWPGFQASRRRCRAFCAATTMLGALCPRYAGKAADSLPEERLHAGRVAVGAHLAVLRRRDRAVFGAGLQHTPARAAERHELGALRRRVVPAAASLTILRQHVGGVDPDETAQQRRLGVRRLRAG